MCRVRYKCGICTKLFKCGRWLRRHYQKFHSEAVDDVDAMNLSQFKVEGAAVAHMSEGVGGEDVSYMVVDVNGQQVTLEHSEVVTSANHVIVAEDGQVIMPEDQHGVPTEGDLTAVYNDSSQDQVVTSSEVDTSVTHSPAASETVQQPLKVIKVKTLGSGSQSPGTVMVRLLPSASGQRVAQVEQVTYMQ